MSFIYHLVPRSVWEQAPSDSYRADSLETEGFIHCSQAHQVAWAANRFYANQADLLVLAIDPGVLTSPVREEPQEWEESQRFPHIYGPINREAVVQCFPLTRDSEGKWEFRP